MTTDIYTTISDILVEKFQVPREGLKPEASLEDLGLDSLALMEFVFAIEDAFKLRIPEERLDPRQGGITLAHMSQVIQEHLPAQKG